MHPVAAIARAQERGPMVVALLDRLALHRHAGTRATDRQMLTDALYSLHRGFVETDAEASMQGGGRAG